MKLCVIGAGYVGLVTAACFADLGNTVYCIEKDEQKLNLLKQGECPIYEPGLHEKLKVNAKAGRLFFLSCATDASDTEIFFIAVGTPMDEDGSAEIKYVLQAAKEIGEIIEQDTIVVLKSTVPVGTYKLVRDTIYQEMHKRKREEKVTIVSNPEFLKEGTAIKDCMSPDRVIIGADEEQAVVLMRELYAPIVRNSERFICMDNASAEMCKYVSNAMLATRISFMNEMAAICEETGADINAVRLGVGSDSRIGYSFLYAGCGYGGSCFPKDLQALIHIAKNNGCEPRILENVKETNQRQKQVLVEKAIRKFGENMQDKRFCIWGLTFKPNTDDMREAPSIEIIKRLLTMGATVYAYDPEARNVDIKAAFGENERFIRVSDKYLAAKNADALFLITEWMEFRSPDFKWLKNEMRNPLIFDGRNQYNMASLMKRGFEYYCIGLQPGHIKA